MDNENIALSYQLTRRISKKFYIKKLHTNICKKGVSRNCENLKPKYRAVIDSLFWKVLKYKQVFKEMLKTLGEQCPSYAIQNNWTASFKGSKLSIDDEKSSGRLASVSTLVNINAIYNEILSDRRVRPKQIYKALNVSYKHVHYVVHFDLDKYFLQYGSPDAGMLARSVEA